MAFGARRVYPNDVRPRVASGVDLPFSEPGVFTSNFQTRDAVKNNLINYLLTNPGERIQNPTFGAGLRKYIFTQIESGNFEFIKDDLQNKINNNFNNIQIDDILVFENENENTINIQIDYNIPNTGINDTLELNFN